MEIIEVRIHKINPEHQFISELKCIDLKAFLKGAGIDSYRYILEARLSERIKESRSQKGIAKKIYEYLRHGIYVSKS